MTMKEDGWRWKRGFDGVEEGSPHNKQKWLAQRTGRRWQQSTNRAGAGNRREKGQAARRGEEEEKSKAE